MSSNPNTGDAKSKRHNFVNITLQVGKEGEGNYSKNGKPFASARAFYSQGKDKSTDEFLPSIWFKVIAFGKDGEDLADNPEVSTLANVQKGDKIEVKGRLGYDEWKINEGDLRSQMVIFATEVKTVDDSNDAEEEEEPQP